MMGAVYAVKNPAVCFQDVHNFLRLHVSSIQYIYCIVKRFSKKIHKNIFFRRYR
jgi:hypothetical protein